MKHGVAGLICLIAMCDFALAESWFRWRDTSGVQYVTRERPPLGVIFQEILLPDPIRWRNAPEMAAEIGAEVNLSLQDMYRTVSQSVYWVAVTAGAFQERPHSVYGSAVAISEDLAITNCHLMLGDDQQATIGSSDQEQHGQVELVASDYAADRCVIRSRGLTLRPVGGVRRVDSLHVGETVYAIGNPQTLDRTLSEGLLSGKRLRGEQRFLQTTAPISPGSSGGGLFDGRGNLIGITTSSLRNAQSINFAIPAEDFWR